MIRTRGRGSLVVTVAALSDQSGLTVTPSSGTLTVAPARSRTGRGADCRPTAPVTKSLSVMAPATGSDPMRANLSTTNGLTLPPIVVDVQVEP